MIVLTIALILLVVALGVRFRHTRDIRDEIASQRARFAARIEGTREGMSFKGDPLDDFQMRGTCRGIEMSLANWMRVEVPGPSGLQQACGRVEFDANIRDMLICRQSDVDKLLGPIPGVARTSTGNPSFDSSYGVFVAPPAGETAASFRDAPGADILIWAKSEVLQEFMEQEVLWFRAQNGRCHLVCPPMGTGAAHSALALCANIARAAVGKSLLEMPEREQPLALVSDPAPFWSIALAALIPALLPGGILAGLTSLGAREKASLEAMGLPPDLHLANCMLAGWALAILILVLVNRRRWLSGHRSPRHLGTNLRR